MRSHIAAALILATLIAAGCSGRQHHTTGQTIEQWRSDHPYAKQSFDIAGANGQRVIELVDKFPRMSFDGNTYEVERRVYTLFVRNGIVAESGMRVEW